MATPTSPPPAPRPPTPPTAAGPHRKEIKLISHSPIFYWWPIWLFGFIFALITYLDDHRIAIIPNGPGGIRVYDAAPPDDAHTAFQVVVPRRNDKEPDSRPSLHHAAEVTKRGNDTNVLKPRVSPRAWLGPVYCVILLLTILSTNVQLRGLWSFLVLLVLILVALLFTVFDVWDNLLRALGGLHIYINMAGYLFVAVTVFVLWVVSVFIFDQRTYIIFTPGQVRVCEHIGASVRNFDSTGLTFEKQRDDLFRHWILGFFSGDLVVRTAGAEREEIRLPNILWIGWKLEDVQEILRQKETVPGT
jgi:hypothetical protein